MKVWANALAIYTVLVFFIYGMMSWEFPFICAGDTWVISFILAGIIILLTALSIPEKKTSRSYASYVVFK